MFTIKVNQGVKWNLESFQTPWVISFGIHLFAIIGLGWFSLPSTSPPPKVVQKIQVGVIKRHSAQPRVKKSTPPPVPKKVAPKPKPKKLEAPPQKVVSKTTPKKPIVPPKKVAPPPKVVSKPKPEPKKPATSTKKSVPKPKPKAPQLPNIQSQRSTPVAPKAPATIPAAVPTPTPSAPVPPVPEVSLTQPELPVSKFQAPEVPEAPQMPQAPIPEPLTSPETTIQPMDLDMAPPTWGRPSEELQSAMQSYNQHLQALVYENLYAPQAFENYLETFVQVSIGVSGELLDSSLKTSSGNEAFDIAVIQAIQKTSFPPLTEELAQSPPYIVIIRVSP